MVIAATTALTGCASLRLPSPFSPAAASKSAHLTGPESAAVKAMEVSAGLQFLGRPIVAIRRTRAYTTGAYEITLTAPYVVRPSVCALGIKYTLPVHTSFVVIYAPGAAHQYDQETFRNGPVNGSVAVHCS